MELKELLVQEPVLKFYTSGRPMKILIGASQFDFAVVGRKLTAYSLCIQLTEMQKRDAQIQTAVRDIA